MAMPPIPMGGPLDAGGPGAPGPMGGPGAENPGENKAAGYTKELDPQFAADIARCKPLAKWTDADMTCLQQAILGLIGGQ